MPPKAKFSRQEIVDAAFGIAASEGFHGITARSVATRLGCSVAPIYVNFTAIEELVAAVIERVQALSGELLAREPGADLFENIGKASLAFAREYPVLFRELVLKPNPYLQSFEAVHEAMLDALAADRAMGTLSFEERRRLFLKMQIFQTGLQVMIANGLTPSWLDRAEAEELLLETGEELLAARIRTERARARTEKRKEKKT